MVVKKSRPQTLDMNVPMSSIVNAVRLLQLRKMQEMIAKMQAEMAKQGGSAANSGQAAPPTANGSTAQGTVHQV